jgi:hypothetical protein
MKRFNVVVARADGGVEVHPMKEWLRQHPDHVPSGLDPTQDNSHSLRDGLKKRGWRIEELPSEVRLLMPGNDQPQNVIDSVLGDNTDDDNVAESEAAFELEYQLRDFIAHNLATIRWSANVSICMLIQQAGMESSFPLAQGRSIFSR